MSLAFEILVPNPEVVATSELKADGKNPNKMTGEQYERLKASIKKFGFIVPIITNKNLLIADPKNCGETPNATHFTEMRFRDGSVETVD